MSLRTRLAAIASAVSVLSTVPLVVTALPAQAACYHPGWLNATAGGSQTDKPGVGSTPIHNGPYADCTVIWRSDDYNDFLYFHCWYQNDSLNYWWHVRKSGTNLEGWVYEPYLLNPAGKNINNHCHT